ncbi:TRAP transporter substrate-binding protein [Chelativorans xinjiangense]|uniref:TRAP transporter substrate-binding protein n=1 Tax=Chelativorans xinjiangense TaxID=2681485 RepID=UPI00135A7B20|nr:TRAP transporter substrate-binding protein [Chelativorans xinjiangense]
MNTIRNALLAGAALFVGAAAANAEELSVVGSWSSLPLYKQYEAPFWTETLPAAGDFEVSMTTFDQMGVAGADVYRMLGDGVFDVGMTVADYTVGDAPELEGLDVPLVATTAEEARKMVEAARPMVEEIMTERFNAKLLAIAPYPPQVVFCKQPVSSLADLKGKKIRGSGRMTTKLLEALGAEGINVDFSEVPGALERGVIDCAVTGAGSGYSAGWWEVSSHLMTLPLGGWDPVVTAINLDKWEALTGEQKELLSTQIESQFEAPAWEAASGALATDVACLTGNGDCPAGEPADMTLVEPTEADAEAARAILQETVLPEWADRAGADWAKRWNESVGETVGVQIPL